jgi:hypothetical protein
MSCRLSSELASALDSLGMTPTSRARLGVDLVRAAAAVEDTAARERLDRRLQALDGSDAAFSPVFEGDDDPQNADPKADPAPPGFAVDEPIDPDGDPDQAEANPEARDPDTLHDQSVSEGRE